MPTIDALAERLSDYLPDDSIQKIRQAYQFAEQAHLGQSRLSGEPYITHPLAVAAILAEMKLDYQSIMAAILHDVIEDTSVHKDMLAQQFDQEVVELVDGVSKLTHLEFESKQLEQAENFQKMAMAMAKDVRVILVKLADRLHNVRTLHFLSPQKRRRIGRETLDIYAPIALRLGINHIRRELEDLCFQKVHPLRSSRLQAAITRYFGEHADTFETHRLAIYERLQTNGIDVQVRLSTQHLFSIYQGMKRRSFAEQIDRLRFLVLTQTVSDCYRALGAIHNLFNPVPRTFKDYIAVPKANGYQSLHTSLISPEGRLVVVQIRTYDMDRIGQYGIAASLVADATDQPVREDAKRWLNNLVEMKAQAGSSLEFLENVKVDLFPDEIYVFTPKGDILKLPKGSTPVDFAYAIHTDVGNRCRSCWVNRKLAVLSQTLESGDSIEILTSSQDGPSPAWLNFVITGKARASIRHFLKSQQRNESIILGRQRLDNALANFGTSVDRLPDADVQAVLSSRPSNQLDDLLEDIGLGNCMPHRMAQRLVRQSLDEQLGIEDQERFVIGPDSYRNLIYAPCCRPIPGDAVLGWVQVGRGIEVHRGDCDIVMQFRRDKPRLIHMEWGQSINAEFLADLALIAQHRKGVLAQVASAVALADSNILAFSLDETSATTCPMYLTIAVVDRQHLARVIRRLRFVKTVGRIARAPFKFFATQS